MKKLFMLLAVVLIMVIAGCGGSGSATSSPPSSAKAVTAFTFPSSTGVTIDEGAHTIVVTVPLGTDVTTLIPTITLTGASVNPASGAAHDFTTPQTYTVTAADASTQAYVVTVTVELLAMVTVPAGSFQRDSTPANISTITTPFRMSQYEITRAQFLAVMGVDPSDATYSTGMTDPVQQVSWYAAIAFCNKLSIAEGLTPVYYVEGVNFSTLTYGAIPTTYNAAWNAAVATWTNNGYRLPTEMEWMWAAMGATSGSGYAGPTYLTGYGKLFAGNDSILANGSGGSHVIGDYAWIWENTDAYMKSHPVGTTGGGGHANELGLYDMSGNVWEWCWDLYASYPSGTLSDFRGAASGMYRSQRGDSWSSLASNMAVAVRSYGSPHVSWNRLGLRVVRP